MAPAGAHFVVYEGKGDKDDRWRWRLRAANGKLTAPSGQAFRDETDARRAVHDHVRAVLGAAGVPDGAMGDIEANVRIEVVSDDDTD